MGSLWMMAIFGQGGFAPANGCTGCTISINADVIVVPFDGQLAANGGVGTTSQVVGANDPALNHITVVGSTINLYGTTTLTLNAFLTLDNSLVLQLPLEIIRLQRGNHFCERPG